MTGDYPILRGLDPHQQRIGYLGAVAKVATRGLDSLDALVERLRDLLFRRINEDEPDYDALKGRVPASRLAALSKLSTSRPPEDDPSSILSPQNVQAHWHYICEFWLLDGVMPSCIGLTKKEKVQRVVDLARQTGVLLPTYELSEVGYLIQHFLSKAITASASPQQINLLNPSAHPLLPLLYTRVLLGSDMLFPYLVLEFVERQAKGMPVSTRGENGLLLAATERLIASIGEPSDPEDMLAVRDVLEFRNSVKKNESTEENYLRPRMELLVDLRLLGRKSDTRDKKAEFMWEVLPETHRLATQWSSLSAKTNLLPEYLERSFFSSMAQVWDHESRPVSGDEERLLWFARGYREVGRDLGFTPGRTVALVASLLAWAEGVTLEIGEQFDAVYANAQSQWGQYLHFSGGSRFDKEFLIRVDSEAISSLERTTRTQTPPASRSPRNP